MDSDKITALLGGWEGYTPGTVGRNTVHGQEEAWIELLPVPGRPRRCGGCGRAVHAIHDRTDRWVRDLPILGAATFLKVTRVRLLCPHCGPRLEELSWLERYARVTTRLAQSVASLCKVLPLKHAAAFYGLDWKTVKAIDKAYLTRTLGEVDLEDLTELAIDEFALRRGHRYATVVIQPATRRVLWVGRGRSRQDVRPFFDLLGKERCGKIRAVAMDMNGAYELEVKAHCPNAQVVFDLFHIVAKYGKEVIDRVRVDAANKLTDDKPARKVIKTARWLLLRNRQNIARPEDLVRLDELLAANKDLAAVYLLKDDLKALWGYRHTGYAQRFWEGWKRRALESGIKPLMAFAQKLEGYIHGILAHCRFPLHTSVLEGINNKIKVLKRMAYGFRDHDYFFLKIRQAFPGVGR